MIRIRKPSRASRPSLRGRLAEPSAPRGAVLLLSLLILSTPAVMAAAGGPPWEEPPYRVNPQGLVKHRHTDSYGLLNGVSSSDPQLKQAVFDARADWDEKLIAEKTVRMPGSFSPKIFVDDLPDDSSAFAVWQAPRHTALTSTALILNTNQRNGLSQDQAQGLVCQALGGIIGLSVAPAPRDDCMSNPMTRRKPSEKSAELVHEFYGPVFEFSGRLYTARDTLFYGESYPLTTQVTGHALQSLSVKLDGVQVASDSTATCSPDPDHCTLSASVTLPSPNQLSLGDHEITATVTNEFPGSTPTTETLPFTVGPAWGFNGGWHGATEHTHINETGIRPGGIGANSNRLSLEWMNIEPNPPLADGNPDRDYIWGPYKAAYNEMVAVGQKPVLVVNTSPSWANSPTEACDPPPPGEDLTCFEPPASAFRDEFATFVKDAMAQFPNILAVEVWNEPNWDRKWYPKANANEYAAMLEVVRDEIGTTETVITGGLHPGAAPANDPLKIVPQATFLSGVYSAVPEPGTVMKNEFDGIGAHAYPYDGDDPDGTLDGANFYLNQLRSVRDANGDQAKNLWLTEIGVGVDATINELEQGEILAHIYKNLNERPGARADVSSMLIYRYQDNPNVPDPDRFDTMGIVDELYLPKESWGHLQCTIGESYVGDDC